MKPIQFILVMGLFGSAVTYFRIFRSSLRDRMLAAALAVAALATVLFPDHTNRLAHAVGVGRGVDLFLYLFAVTCIFCIVLLYSKIARLERSQTELVRAMALATAQEPKDR